VLAVLTASDLRARYGRGPWQLLKWLADPFALVGVYLVLVAVLLDRGGSAPGLSLACAVVAFQLVTMTVINSMGAIALRESIILNLRFERTLIPLSASLTEFIGFGASAVLLAVMMAVYGIAPTAAALWLPVIVALNWLLALAFAYAASLFGLWFPDLRNFGLSFVRTLFFLAPGLVPLSEMEGTASELVRLNPLTGLFEAYRDALLYGHAPAAWELLYPMAFATLLSAAVLPVYRREQRHFAKVLEG